MTSLTIVQVGLGFRILVPQSLECWDDRCVLPHLAQVSVMYTLKDLVCPLPSATPQATEGGLLEVPVSYNHLNVQVA